MWKGGVEGGNFFAEFCNFVHKRPHMNLNFKRCMFFYLSHRLLFKGGGVFVLWIMWTNF